MICDSLFYCLRKGGGDSIDLPFLVSAVHKLHLLRDHTAVRRRPVQPRSALQVVLRIYSHGQSLAFPRNYGFCKSCVGAKVLLFPFVDAFLLQREVPEEMEYKKSELTPKFACRLCSRRLVRLQACTCVCQNST